jgi:DNA-directed RNA polymerase specialized sigma24 family protein
MTIENINLIKLKNGDEAGLSYFYGRFYAWYSFRAFRYMREELEAQCAVQEAFLRLWINRANVESVESIHTFLKHQIQDAARLYHRKKSNAFRRNFIYFFDYDDPDILLGEEDKGEEYGVWERIAPDSKDEERLATVLKLLPNLGKEQELFIRLCLRFDFNFERIAFYLGGIRDYEVANRVNKCIEQLKSLLADSQKLSGVARGPKVHKNTALSAEQAEILKMRYELGASFEEIAECLRLSASRVREIFIQAFTVLKSGKTHTHAKNSVGHTV